MVNAVGKDRLMLKSNMMLKLSRGATLKAIPNGSTHYSVLSISDASNVTVVGGTLVGDRHDSYEQAGDFIANFADKCHHGKGLSRHRPFVLPLLKIVYLLESAVGVRSLDR